ncbi:hypothetical protein OE88DRAFT_1732938 [Heliocybe sulcata]|uniref:F-box domain-containing protein n=1 Tax=Heliocybe sulcata TaxID=5364 RepID=A0A5C3NAG3_9AGAM|nr:hypothetical protein OE88DRAFT_1732938 [Heliocybe sulcata]
MFEKLPDEIVLQILTGLCIRDLFNAQGTCAQTSRVLHERGPWYDALCNVLALPRSAVTTVLKGASVEEVRHRAMKAQYVNENWARTRVHPRHVRTYRWRGLRDIQILPGGEWLVCVSMDGTLEMRKVERSLQVVIASRFFLGIVPLYRKTCCSRLYVYEVVVSPEPNLRCMIAISTSDLGRQARSFRNAAISGNILAFDCYWDGRDMLCLRSIIPNSDGVQEQAAFLYDKSNCTIHILSSHIVLLADGSSIQVHKIPRLYPVSDTNASPEVVENEIIFSHQLQLTSPGNMSGSPAVWDHLNGGHIGPMTLLGPGTLHIVQPSADLKNYELSTFRVPEIIASYPAVGLRYGLSAQIEPGHGLVFRTVKHPDVVEHDDKEQRPPVSSDRVPMGHFVVDEIKHLAPIAVRIDEWTGRACLILEDGPDHRSLAILDIV